MIQTLGSSLAGCVVFVCATGAGLRAGSSDTVEPTARARSAPVFTTHAENDSFTGIDQHYTNGVKFSWLSTDLVDWGQKNFGSLTSSREY